MAFFPANSYEKENYWLFNVQGQGKLGKTEN